MEPSLASLNKIAGFSSGIETEIAESVSSKMLCFKNSIAVEDESKGQDEEEEDDVDDNGDGAPDNENIPSLCFC